MSATATPTIRRALFAGICALAIGMGVGRFAYTPLLPLMQDAVGFGNDTAGLLASLNYLGYLAGALAATALPRNAPRVALLRASLAVSIAATGGMALTANLWAWGVLRLIAGIASAGMLILSADLVLRTLSRHGRPALLGVAFAGVGTGVALSGVIVAATGEALGWAGGWAILALVCVVLAPFCWLWLRMPAGEAPPAPAHRSGAPRRSFPLALLIAAYFCEGAGYIVTGTFLVAIVKTMPGLAGFAEHFWIVVGLAAAPSAIVWSGVAARIGLVVALVLAYLVQAIGIVLPVLSGSPAAVLVSALLFGGTFVGITPLTIALGGRAGAANPGRVIGGLTAAFGLGQIIGPIVAGVLASGGRGFDSALIIAAIAVGAGAILLVVGALARTLPKRTGALRAG